MRLVLLAITTLLLAACGGSGQPSTADDPAVPSTVMTRAVPGGRIDVTALDGGAWRVTTDLEGISGVEVFLGVDYAGATPLAVAAAPGGSWVVQPGGTAGPFLVRITRSDGSQIETGADDFPRE